MIIDYIWESLTDQGINECWIRTLKNIYGNQGHMSNWRRKGENFKLGG